jgi:hypothetical protein
MKHIFSLAFLFIAAFNVAAQNKSPYTSPPGIASQDNGNIELNKNLMNYKTNFTGLQLINGSFEINTGKCIINGSNSYITNNVAATTAYGCGNEIDLMNNSCGYGTAISGQYFLCLSNGKVTCGDACNLQLTNSLITGNIYTISYFDRGWDRIGCCPPGVVLEVGISSDATSQGKIVYTSPVPTTNVWSQRVFSFRAPINGKYISFHAKDNSGRWTHIDSVTISTTQCPPPNTLNVQTIDATSATLTWNAPLTAADNYLLYYRVKGTNTIIFKKVRGVVTTYMLTGLSANTTYEWGLASICKGNRSYITRGPEFTTASFLSAADNIKIYPNPAQNFVLVDGLPPIGKNKLSIIDVTGNVMLVTYISGKSYNWNIASLKAGNYFLKIETNDAVITRSFVKE